MSIRSLESATRRVARRFGLDIHRYRPEKSPHALLSSMLATHQVNLVMDIGANTGQFARSMREAGYRQRLVSFEPLSEAHAELLRSSRADPLWDIAPRAAVGDFDGEIAINISRNSFSSSVLDMLERHVHAAPESAYSGREQAPIVRLDTIAPRYTDENTVPFLKIDTQGYEDRVLDGAGEYLDVVAGLQLELSFVALYEGQRLFDSMLDRLSRLEFSMWAVWPGICEPGTGRMLQVDATFFRDRR